MIRGRDIGTTRIMDFSFSDGDSIQFENLEISSVGRLGNIITASTIDASGTMGQLEVVCSRSTLWGADANQLMEDLIARIN